MIRFELLNNTQHTIDKQAIEEGLKAAEKKVDKLGDRHIVIEIISPEESQKLNKELRHKDEPTDILSISSLDTRVGEQVISEEKDGSLRFKLKQETFIDHDWPVLGQLVICYDILLTNAKQAGQSPERELKWVIEHGVLHILGFHHDSDT
jgi:probable rRNA maturation factor